MSHDLPSNVHISTHPCVRAKLSQLRCQHTNGRDTKTLVHEISLLLGSEALRGNLTVIDGEKDTTPLGYTYTTQTLVPRCISLIPILRSGLGMVEAIQTLLPQPIPVHHLGLFRDPVSLQPVEYYNNLPYHRRRPRNNNNNNNNSGGTTPDDDDDDDNDDENENNNNNNNNKTHLAILVDPIIATGGTAAAAISTLRDWGVTKIVLISVLGSVQGVMRAAEECALWEEAGGNSFVGAEIWLAGIDDEIDERGMLRPGLGDVGDRLFLTVGK